ncbi:MAG: hypothetical protein ACRC0L_02990 [Angustibacter sp.]
MALTFAACSSTQEPITAEPNAYREDILLAARTTDSAYQRRILADGIIERTEYEEAVNKTIDCVADRGFFLGKISQPGGFYTFSMESSAAGDGAYSECQRQFSNQVEGFFSDHIINPEKRDMDELLTECFKRKGIAPATYTVSQLRADVLRQFKNSVVQQDGPAWSACLASPALP